VRVCVLNLFQAAGDFLELILLQVVKQQLVFGQLQVVAYAPTLSIAPLDQVIYRLLSCLGLLGNCILFLYFAVGGLIGGLLILLLLSCAEVRSFDDLWKDNVLAA